MRLRKAQLYGISAFLYALAIAIILIVGMLGLSKDLESASQASFFRFSAISAAKNAEMFKKLLDQERGYAVDKSLFATGSFGGYSISDLIPSQDCTLPTCGSTCPTGSVCITAGINKGKCRRGSQVILPNYCFPNINNGAGFSCGRKDLNVPYIAEKYLPYWRVNSYTCIPSFEKVMETFRTYAGQFYAKPNENVLNALTAGTMYPIYFNYYLDFNLQRDVNTEDGILQTRWIPVGQDYIILSVPPENPSVEYEVKPYVHLFSKTRFFDVYYEAKSFVEDEYFEDFLKDPQYSPIPSIIDKDQSVVKHYSDGSIEACVCSDTQFDSDGDGTVDKDLAPGETCTEDTTLCKSPQQPFKVLVDYIKNNPDLYPNEEPNLCSFPTSISDTYSGNCKVHAIMTDEGKLRVDYFSGDCSTTSNNDNNAMKCVIKRIINRMNKELLSKPVEKNVASLYWGAQIKAVDYSDPTAPARIEGELYNQRLQHVIDGDETHYDGSYGYGYVLWDPNGDGGVDDAQAMIITLADEYVIDSVRIHLWDKDDRYYLYKIEGSLDGVHWNKLVDATTGSHKSVEEWNITPMKVKYIRITGTKNTANNQFHVVEFQAFADIEYRYLISSFDLEYTGSGFSDKVYNATDLDSGGDAPRAIAEPDPADCTDAICKPETTEYCANFPGEDCPCCGEGIGGPGLSCCNTSYADSDYKNKCWEEVCVGEVNIVVDPTSIKKCSSANVIVTGLCNYCDSKTATISWTGCGSGSVTTETFGAGGINTGGVSEIITFTTPGTCTITATVDINGDGDTNDAGETASTTLIINDCGLDGLEACDDDCSNYYNGCIDGTAKAPSTYSTGSYSYTQGYCYTCGGDNQICCDNVEDGATFDNNKCNTGYCSGGNTPQCVPCGTLNQPQCPYTDTGMYNGCYDTSPPLAPNGSGICVECGFAGDICCDNEYTDGYFDDTQGCYHFAFSAWGTIPGYRNTCSGGTCVPCGSEGGQPPCPTCTGTAGFLGYYVGVNCGSPFDKCYFPAYLGTDNLCHGGSKCWHAKSGSGVSIGCGTSSCTTAVICQDTAPTCVYYTGVWPLCDSHTVTADTYTRCGEKFQYPTTVSGDCQDCVISGYLCSDSLRTSIGYNKEPGDWWCDGSYVSFTCTSNYVQGYIDYND